MIFMEDREEVWNFLKACNFLDFQKFLQKKGLGLGSKFLCHAETLLT